MQCIFWASFPTNRTMLSNLQWKFYGIHFIVSFGISEIYPNKLSLGDTPFSNYSNLFFIYWWPTICFTNISHTINASWLGIWYAFKNLDMSSIVVNLYLFPLRPYEFHQIISLGRYSNVTSYYDNLKKGLNKREYFVDSYGALVIVCG